MGSRKVVLLTKGYFRGLLDFKYQFSYSALREAVILDQIEKEELSQILSQRLQLDNAIFAIKPSNDSLKGPIGTLDKFVELKLPYAKESSKISSATRPLTEEDKEYWRQIHAERKRLRENGTTSTK